MLNAHFSLGYYYRGSSKYDSAIYHTQEALRLAEETHSDFDRTRGLYNLARVYHDKGDYSSALATNIQGLALARAIGSRKSEAFQLTQSGLIKTALGEWEAARVEFDQALRISQSLKDHIGMGRAYSGLGEMNRQQSRWNLAGRYYTEAAASYQHVYNTTGLLAVQLDIAEMVDRQGNHEAARRAAVRLLRLAQQADMDKTTIRAQLLLGRIYLATSKPDSAQLYGQQSLVATRRNGLRPETLEAAHLLAQAYAQRGRWNAAYRYQVLASLYVDSLTGEATRRRVAGLQGQAARSQQAHQLLLLRQRARLQAQQQELARLRYRQQVGALAGLAGLVLALSVGVLWHDRRRERHRQEALRTRIAADLHDEVGSILTQISMQSTLLREGGYPPAAASLPRPDGGGQPPRRPPDERCRMEH
ncbi:MAG: tetratricopeptide repeat protein [Hymenobacter sp.]